MPVVTEKHCRHQSDPKDGFRILVMRYWPRGVRKDTIDVWLRELAPSVELLKWCRAQAASSDYDAEAYRAEWTGRYRVEMAQPEAQRMIAELRQRHEQGETLTLLCACHNPAVFHRTALASLVLGLSE